MRNPVIHNRTRYAAWRAPLDALLVLLFTYAALSKLLDYANFRVQMENQVFPAGINLALFYGLPPLELAAGLMLVLPHCSCAGRRLSLVLLAGFTAYVALVMLHFWHRVPCSCGGILGKLKWGPHLLLNVFFLLVTLASIYLERKERRTGAA